MVIEIGACCIGKWFALVGCVGATISCSLGEIPSLQLEIDEVIFWGSCSSAEMNISGNGVLLDTHEQKKHPTPAVIGASNNLLQFETIRESFGSFTREQCFGAECNYGYNKM